MTTVYGLEASALLAANVRGALLASIVLYVLFAWLLLYNAVGRAGAIRGIGSAAAPASPYAWSATAVTPAFRAQ